MTELRKGDKVSVTGTVEYTPDGDENIFVKIDGSSEKLWCKQSIVTLVQAKFDIGDRVAFDGYTGEIIAINGDFAWTNVGNGNYCTRPLEAMIRLSEPPEEEPPQPVDDGSCDPLYGERMDSADLGEEPRTAAGSLD